jgi:drug/metabolite transporter (DMT)-like permease
LGDLDTFHFGTGERWAVVSAVAYTIVNITLRVAAPTIDPALGSLLRLTPLAVIAWLVVARGGARELRPSLPAFLSWRLIGALLLGGSSSLVIGNILFFNALTTGGLGIAIGGSQSGSVLGGLWIGYLALRERPRQAQLAGAALIVLGLVGIAIAQTSNVAGLWWLGLLFALGAGTTYALANTLSRLVQRQRPLLFVALALSSLGGLVPLTLIVLGRAALGDHITADARSAGAVLFAGLANSVALASLALAVRAAPVAAVNTISSASIVFSFIASVVVFNETGSPPMVAGIALVTAGIVVAQLRRRGADPTEDVESVAAAVGEGEPYAPRSATRQRPDSGEVNRRK